MEIIIFYPINIKLLKILKNFLIIWDLFIGEKSKNRFRWWNIVKSLPVRGSTVGSRYRTRYTTLPSRVTVSDRGHRSRGRSSGRSSSRGHAGEAEHHGEKVVQVRVVLSATIEGNERDERFVVVVLIFLFVIVRDDDRGLLGFFPMVNLGTIRGHLCIRVGWLCGCWSNSWCCLGGERGSQFRFRLALQGIFIEFRNFLISSTIGWYRTHVLYAVWERNVQTLIIMIIYSDILTLLAIYGI